MRGWEGEKRGNDINILIFQVVRIRTIKRRRKSKQKQKQKTTKLL